MRRSRGLRRTGRLKRRARLRRTEPPARRTPLHRTAYQGASEAQRAKVRGARCIVCGEGPVDPAHLVARARGGCDHSDCVVALCRRHHREFDRGALDLLPHLEPDHRAELAHAAGHLPLLALLLRLTGVRWAPESRLIAHQPKESENAQQDG